jgi:hypothetical protein
MSKSHPALGRFIESYSLDPFKQGLWWLPLPATVVIGALIAAVRPPEGFDESLVIWLGLVALAGFWVTYQWRELSMRVPLVVYEHGFLWDHDGDHAEILYAEVMAMTPEERRPVLPFAKPQIWWVIEAEEGLEMVIGPNVKGHLEAVEWIAARVAETLPEPVRRTA